MKLAIEWVRPISLKLNSAGASTYTCEFSHLPAVAGIYVFGRRHGKKFHVLYVGRANDLKKRIATQLNNDRLMNHLRAAPSGKREIIAGVFIAKRGQSADRCLPIIERNLIRYFLLNNHDLSNIQGATLWQHELSFSGAFNIGHDIIHTSN